MLNAIFHRASVRERIESNPLGAVLRDYVGYLGSRGHRPGPLHQYVFAVEHFGRWVGARAIDHAAVDRFIRVHLPHCRCAKPCPRNVACVRAALHRLLEMLGAEHTPVDCGAIGSLLRDYEAHLRHACGLARITILYRQRYARDFMRAQGMRHARDLRTWSPEQVSRYVAMLGRRCKPSSGQVAASSIRSFLRFLLLRGFVARDLALSVPSFAHWRLATLPATVEQDDLKRLVAAADRASSIGKRDRAVLMCMTELGLRAVEVASITKDDVDLDAGVLRVRRPKQRDRVEVPMTRRLTSAIRSYLRRGRPACTSPALFVKHRAPVGGPLKPIGIHSMVVRRAADSGLADRVRGTHIIRHSIATTLSNAGTPMKQIADLLGHRCIDTTTIYAKVDLASLRRVALPWPAADRVEMRR
jgi:integrase/recombinase XerD